MPERPRRAQQDIDLRLWVGRALVGAVTAINVQCALAFLLQPARYAPGFGLAGDIGAGTLRGFGVLFLMWNVPYIFAAIQPRGNRRSLLEALLMQTIGLVGESLILRSLPFANPLVRQTIGRFVVFDAGGLLTLLLAAWITRGAGSSQV